MILKGKYQIGEVIGSGGFGTTYAGRDLDLDMKVAVKKYTGQDEKGKEEFLREARILAKFSGEPGIVNVRDFLEEDGEAYIVMEYLDGMDLGQSIEKEGKLSFAEAASLLMPVMEVLAKIHRTGIIHRDISPDNIMVLQDHTVKLLDFGAAREFCQDDPRTMTVMLKPGYAPPEQYRGKEYQGPWTDVYSVCATIYKCVTGETPVDSLQRLFQDDLKKPSQLGAHIAPEDEALLMHGLAVSPEERIQSMEELMRGLHDKSAHQKTGEKSAGEAIHAERKPKPPVKAHGSSGRRKKGRKKGLFWGTAAFLVLAAAAVLLLGRPHNPYREDDSPFVYLSEEQVTPKMIRTIGRDKEITYLTLRECTLDDETIEAIAAMKNIEGLELDSCTGFTSLAALEKMSELTELELRAGEDTGEEWPKMLDGYFPQIETLRISYADFGNDTDFLRNFPGLTLLTLRGNEGIGNLDFLEAMPEMRALTIEGDLFSEVCTDLSGDRLLPVAGCTRLEQFCASGTGIDDLSPFSSCKNLQIMEINDCEISDISPLTECSQLLWLYLNGNRISDIMPLSELENMEYLGLSGNRISDISPLSGLEGLRELDLSDNEIEKIDALEGKENLSTLCLDKNRLTDLSALVFCRNMETFSADNNRLSSLKGCEQMIDLKELSAAHNSIVDISALKNCSRLRNISLRDNRIVDLSALSNHFAELEQLDISENEVEDLTCLESCTAMTVLLADHNNLTGLQGIESMAELIGLTAYDNQITDIGALSMASGIRYLDLGKNQIRDISAIARMQAGRLALLLDENQISDLSALPLGNEYEALVLHKNPVEDFGIFREFDKVDPYSSLLYLSYTDEENYKKLIGSEYGYELYIVGIPLEKQGEAKRIWEEQKGIYSGPNFLTEEEADGNMEEYRKTIRDVLGGSEDEEE